MTEAVTAAFDRQSGYCRELGSPFTARLAVLHGDYLDRRTAVGRRVLDWEGDPQADALPLRLFGALHALVLAEADEELAHVYPPHEADDAALGRAVRIALNRHEAHVLATLDSPPQTNEVARSAMLLPGFITLAKETRLPLDILELGASAGVNLIWDRYRYRYGEIGWGDPAAPLLIEADGKGLPPLDAVPVITRRRACDQSPLDAGDPAHRLRLLAYVWADQTERLARLRLALDEVAAQDIEVERADAAEFAERHLAAPPLEGTLRLVVHTIFWQYLSAGTKARIEAAIVASARSGPVAWLRLEADGQDPGAGLYLTRLLGGPASRTDEMLARADFHGRWIDWRGVMTSSPAHSLRP